MGYPGAKALTEVSRAKLHGATEGENVAKYSEVPFLLSFPSPTAGATRRNRY